MDGERLGRRIRAFRKLKRLQQAELAKQLNVSTSLLGRIERGDKVPNLAMLENIAEVLNISIEEFTQLLVSNEEEGR